MAVAAALILIAAGCDEGRRDSAPGGDNGGDGRGPGTQRCQDDDECSDPTPFCSGGACSATDDGGGGGIGDGNGGGAGGEGEGEGEAGGQGGDDGDEPGDGSLCSVCTGLAEGECGEEGRCILFRDQNKYCSAPCGEGNTCQPGFDCVEQWEPPQCLPVAAACEGNCAVHGCDEDGQICDFAFGVCRTPKGHCEECTTDEECDGGGCAQLQEGTYCVAECVEGADDCPAGSSCAGTFCMPNEGICDRCDGVECNGLTPFCEPTTGECAGCLTDQDCGQGSFCALGECREAQGECLSNGDCNGNPEGSYCFVDRCVECIASEHCPPRNICEANSCVSALCEGLLCQGGAECDPGSGKCAPSCEQTGCLDAQDCDAETGQCYNSDGTCDPESPCRPGSVCGAGGGLPGAEPGAKCTCPNNIVQCASADDCVGFPGGCNPQFSTCEVACAVPGRYSVAAIGRSRASHSCLSPMMSQSFRGSSNQ